jgi:hypothetical protein
MKLLLSLLFVGCLIIQGCATMGRATVRVPPAHPEQSSLDFSIEWPSNTIPGGSPYEKTNTY